MNVHRRRMLAASMAVGALLYFGQLGVARAGRDCFSQAGFSQRPEVRALASRVADARGGLKMPAGRRPSGGGNFAGQTRRTPPARKRVGRGAGGGQGVNVLTVGQGVERKETIAAGKHVIYEASIKRGGLIVAEVVSERGDAIVAVIDGQGKILGVSDYTEHGGKELLLVAPNEDGQYYVSVLAGESVPGQWVFSISVRVKDTVTADDRRRLNAQALMSEAKDVEQREPDGSGAVTADEVLKLDPAQAEAVRGVVAKWEEAAGLWNEAGEKYWQALSLYVAGVKSFRMGENERALALLSRASALQKEVGDRGGEAWTLHDTAKVYSAVGNQERAMEFFQRSLALSAGRSTEAHLLTDIGGLYGAIGRRQEALEYHGRALALAESIKDAAAVALSLNNLGVIYVDLGELAKARAAFERAQPLWKSLGDKQGEGSTWHNLGTIQERLGDADAALEAYLKAMSLASEENNGRGQLVAINSVAILLAKRRDNKAAILNFKKALELGSELDDKTLEGYVLTSLGLIYAGLGDKAEALEYQRRALFVHIDNADPKGEVITLDNLAASWAKFGEPRISVFYAKQAVIRTQELRDSIRGLDNETQKSFLASNANPYRNLAELLINMDRWPEAQQVLNLLRDQEYFDFSRPARPTAPGEVSLALTPREASLTTLYGAAGTAAAAAQHKLNDLRGRLAGRQPGAADASELNSLEKESRAASDGFSKVLKQVETDLGGDAADGDEVGAIRETHELVVTLRELTEQTGLKAVAIYTLVNEEYYYSLIITPDGRIGATKRPFKEAEVTSKALALWSVFQSDRQDPTAAAHDLYDVVFEPLERYVKESGAQTLLWGLDGALRYVPMAALYDGKRYLVERYQSVVFTRASRERLTRTPTRDWTGLGLGSSRRHTVRVAGGSVNFNALPGVRQELEGIFGDGAARGGIFRGRVLSDADFSAASMMAELKSRRPLVHIASHFYFRPGEEQASFLLLGDGTTLTLAQMKQQVGMFDGVELLALSACQTAAQLPSADGREVDGMAELVQRLGANAVLATLWRVADRSTSQWMREFYRARQEGAGAGLTKAAALQKAQLALLYGEKNKSDGGVHTPPQTAPPARVAPAVGAATSYSHDPRRPFAHPYYWAPFILVGNWR